MTWLRQMTLWEFNKLMFHAEKNISRLSKVAINDIIKEFKRRKMLNPTREGGTAIYVPSFILKAKAEEMLPEVKNEFTISLEDLKDLVNVEIEEELKIKKRKKKLKQEDIDYIDRLRRMTSLLEEKEQEEEDDLEELLIKAKKIVSGMTKTKDLTPFKDFIPRNTSRPLLNLILHKVCEKSSKGKLIIFSDDKEIIDLYNSYVRGT